MRFERVAANVKTSLHCRDAVVDNKADGDFAQSHSDHFAETDRRIGDSRPDPETEEVKKDDRKRFVGRAFVLMSVPVIEIRIEREWPCEPENEPMPWNPPNPRLHFDPWREMMMAAGSKSISISTRWMIPRTPSIIRRTNCWRVRARLGLAFSPSHCMMPSLIDRKSSPMRQQWASCSFPQLRCGYAELMSFS